MRLFDPQLLAPAVPKMLIEVENGLGNAIGESESAAKALVLEFGKSLDILRLRKKLLMEQLRTKTETSDYGARTCHLVGMFFSSLKEAHLLIQGRDKLDDMPLLPFQTNPAAIFIGSIGFLLTGRLMGLSPERNREVFLKSGGNPLFVEKSEKIVYALDLGKGTFDGIDTDRLEQDDTPPLLRAAASSPEHIERLFKSIHLLEDRDDDGWTAFHYAAMGNRLDSAELLLSLGFVIGPSQEGISVKDISDIVSISQDSRRGFEMISLMSKIDKNTPQRRERML